jgi:hypothetical protein
MSAGELEMKERILMSRIAYSILKERIKGHECGWSSQSEFQPTLHIPRLALASVIASTTHGHPPHLRRGIQLQLDPHHHAFIASDM